jgi:hypothetical protein
LFCVEDGLVVCAPPKNNGFRGSRTAERRTYGGEQRTGGGPLPAHAKARLTRLLDRLELVLERMISGRAKTNKLKRLLPWTWKAEHPAATVHA